MEELNDSFLIDDDTPPDDKSNETVKGRFTIQEINEEDLYLDTLKSINEKRRNSFENDKRIKHQIIDEDFPLIFKSKCFIFDEGTNSFEDLERIFQGVKDKTLTTMLSVQGFDKHLQQGLGKERDNFIYSSQVENFFLQYREEVSQTKPALPPIKSDVIFKINSKANEDDLIKLRAVRTIQSESSFTLKNVSLKETYRNICHNCIKNIQFKI